MSEQNSNIPYWFNSDDNKVALYSSVKIVRNFRAINFPSAGDHNSYRQVERRADIILESGIEDGSVVKYDLSSMDQAEILRLQKFRIIPDKRNDILSKMKLYYNSGYQAYLLINYIDHLTFFSHSCGRDIGKAYKNCSAFSQMFDRTELSKDENGNYHTASLDYFGSGLKCFSVLTIPAIRLFGDTGSVISSLKHNKISCRDYFSSNDIEMIIISNADSLSKNADETVLNFDKILDGIEKISQDIIRENSHKTEELKQKCLRIINYDFLTFKNFMEIYHILSFMRITGSGSIHISELNGQLGALILDSSKTAVNGGLKKSVMNGLIEKINNNYNKEQ